MSTRCPNLLILAGPNGSGENTFATRLQEHEWGRDGVNLNADALALELGDWNDMECIRRAQLLVRE